MSPQPLGSKNDVDHYFESAVNSYIHKARSPFFGSRATLISYELFKQRNMYRESPVSLTRMTADVSSCFVLTMYAQDVHGTSLRIKA